MENTEFEDYEVVKIPLESGEEVEFAILEQLEVAGQQYAVLSTVEGDALGDDIHIFRCWDFGSEIQFGDVESQEELDGVLAAIEAEESEE